MEAENLYNCQVIYHLVNGQTVSEIFHQDLPKEVWQKVKEEFADELIDYFELDADEKHSSILLPKNSVLYITMKISN
jgi:hypothetical protein